MKETRDLMPRPVEPVVDLERPFDQQIGAGVGRYPAYREVYEQDGFQLIDYWRAIRKRLWLVVGVAVLATTLSAIYMARKPDIFMAAAKVQVDLEQTNPDLVTPDRQRPISNPDPTYFNTQLQLLSSDTILRRVIKEHSLDSNKAFQDEAMNGSTSLLRSVFRSIGLVSDRSAVDEGSLDQFNSSINSSLLSADEIAEAIRLAPYVTALKRNLNVEPVREPRTTLKDTRLIDVSFRHTNPDVAAFVVNSLGETFANANQEQRTGTSRKTSDFLQKRIADLQSDIRADELKLVELERNENILKTPGDQTIVLERLAGLNKDLLTAENERKTAEAEYNSVRNSPERLRSVADAESMRFITERENMLIAFRNETQKNIAALNANKARLLEEFRESAPEIKEIDSQVASLENSLAKETEKANTEIRSYRDRTAKNLLDVLETRFRRAKEKEDKIRAAFNLQFNEAQGQNVGEVMLRLLRQNIDTNRGFLENLRKQLSSTDVASQGSDNNIRVAEYAIPPKEPVSPRRLLTVTSVLFLSTLFGMGLALFLEYLDDTIRTTEEIESYLQLPALAAIPSIESGSKRKLLLVGGTEKPDEDELARSELLIHSDPKSSLAEAYRQLRTSILLSTAGHAPKSLLVTSSLPSEGKTTTAANTAITLAQTGASVLVIDADMRRPRLHSVFGIENGAGLSTLLSSALDQNEVFSTIKRDEAANLSVLTSGPIPPNPAELIGSEQMSNLLKMVQGYFTHVVVDSPPINSFTDGVLIASMVDGVILVVHSGKSSRQVVRRAKQLLQDIGARIFGVVLNNIDLNSHDNYYYYQSYYDRNSYFSSDERE
ncbi:MAG TPA: polysaccharide biosynthesis tyrosine autokinase [Pyrinomonadaceae bacterium]|nr:polysaccharide biosynthesis tyrosine autokinase [Pyrinomonadaceae bacterium]HMP64935.1 polysaccharide biosynthesis tyrosine autokinase [Pyrinomonadaceae bacterium]